MKAAFYLTNGEPEVLQYGEVENPPCGPGDVAIAVEAISLEGGDILKRRNTPVSSAREIVGYQASGVVSEVGENVRALRPGDRVVGFNWSGSHADRFVVPEHFAYPVPNQVDIKTAAAVPVAYGTASEALFEFGYLRSGETVLVHGATANVGIALVQLAKRAGATVIGTGTSVEKLDRLREFGLDGGVRLGVDDIRKMVIDLTGGTGVDLALDLIGAPYFADIVGSLRSRGRMVLIGAASGQKPTIDYLTVRQTGISITGLTFGKEMHRPRARAMIAEIFADVAAGKLVIPIDSTFPLANAAAAHRRAERERPFGKVIMIP